MMRLQRWDRKLSFTWDVTDTHTQTRTHARARVFLAPIMLHLTRIYSGVRAHARGHTHTHAHTQHTQRPQTLSHTHTRTQATGEGKGAAFVKFEDYECAVAAIKALHHQTTLPGTHTHTHTQSAAPSNRPCCESSLPPQSRP